MKKIVCLTLALLLAVSALSGCSLSRDKDYLVIYNWEDYIDEGIVEEFEDWYRENGHPNFAGVRYETFDTNETFYTKVTKGKEYWDVACPSDYMIGKMAAKNMLAPVETDKMDNFKNLSPYMREKFQEIVSAAAPNPEDNVYGVGYMWGTMGIIYNTESVANNKSDHPSFAPIDSWKVMWDSYYRNRVYIKNSMREAFTIGSLYAYSDDLLAQQALLSESDYTDYLTVKLNEVSPSSLSLIERSLKDQRTAVNVKYDVDFDKEAMANASADLDFCWSGDGNMAIQMGAANEVEIGYSIPEEGTNIFFDGWVMNKDSRHKEAATAFLNYMCNPEAAIANMEFIGYVSCVATPEILDWANLSWKTAIFGGTDEEGEEIDPTHAHMADQASGYGDLTLFFGKETLDSYLTEYGALQDQLKVNPVQYPAAGIFHKLAIMKTYTDEENDLVLKMWSNVKGGDLEIAPIILVAALFAAMIAIMVIRFIRNLQKKKHKLRKHRLERQYTRI